MPLRRSRRLRRIPASLLTVASATITAIVFTTVPAQTATTASQSADPPTSSEIPSGYYDAADGLSGDQLKTALNGIIDNHTTLSYDQVWDALKAVDEDPNNSANVITVYSQLSLPKSSNGGDPDQWNREHTWAKSHGDFGTAAGPGTDVHHLMPEDVSVNGTRGNLDFDDTTGSVDQCSDCGVDGDSFEPPAVSKGDIARAMFYMAVRYEGTDSYVDLELNDQVGNGSAPYIGKSSVLKAWHEADPPSEFEINRNDAIYADWQGNRNPFVDHPEWVESIW